MWSNWVHLVTIVLEFVLHTGFINPLGLLPLFSSLFFLTAI